MSNLLPQENTSSDMQGNGGTEGTQQMLPAEQHPPVNASHNGTMFLDYCATSQGLPMDCPQHSHDPLPGTSNQDLADANNEFLPPNASPNSTAKHPGFCIVCCLEQSDLVSHMAKHSKEEMISALMNKSKLSTSMAGTGLLHCLNQPHISVDFAQQARYSQVSQSSEMSLNNESGMQQASVTAAAAAAALLHLGGNSGQRMSGAGLSSGLVSNTATFSDTEVTVKSTTHNQPPPDYHQHHTRVSTQVALCNQAETSLTAGGISHPHFNCISETMFQPKSLSSPQVLVQDSNSVSQASINDGIAVPSMDQQYNPGNLLTMASQVPLLMMQNNMALTYQSQDLQPNSNELNNSIQLQQNSPFQPSMVLPSPRYRLLPSQSQLHPSVPLISRPSFPVNYIVLNNNGNAILSPMPTTVQINGNYLMNSNGSIMPGTLSNIQMASVNQVAGVTSFVGQGLPLQTQFLKTNDPQPSISVSPCFMTQLDAATPLLKSHFPPPTNQVNVSGDTPAPLQDSKLNLGLLAGNNGITTSDTPIMSDGSSASVASLSSCKNSLTTVRVGSNITISLPEGMADKKERLQQIINEELVRGILLNDSHDVTVDTLNKQINRNNIAQNKPRDSAELESGEPCGRLKDDKTNIEYFGDMSNAVSDVVINPNEAADDSEASRSKSFQLHALSTSNSCIKPQNPSGKLICHASGQSSCPAVQVMSSTHGQELPARPSDNIFLVNTSPPALPQQTSTDTLASLSTDCHLAHKDSTILSQDANDGQLDPLCVQDKETSNARINKENFATSFSNFLKKDNTKELTDSPRKRLSDSPFASSSSSFRVLSLADVEDPGLFDLKIKVKQDDLGGLDEDRVLFSPSSSASNNNSSSSAGLRAEEDLSLRTAETLADSDSEHDRAISRTSSGGGSGGGSRGSFCPDDTRSFPDPTSVLQLTMDASDSLATSEVLLTNLSSEDNSSSTNVASSTASPASQTHISSPNSITSTRRRSRCRRSTASSIASTFVASSSASPSSSESDSLFSIDSPVDLRYVQNNGLQEDKIQPNGDTVNNVDVNTQPNNNTLKDIQNNTQSNSDTINNNRESGYACSSWQDTFSSPARRRRHDPSKQHKITQDNIHPTHHSNTQATHHSSTKAPEARAPMSPAKRNMLMEDFDLRLPELSSPESSLLSPASLPGLLSPTPRSSFLSSTTQPSLLSPTPRPSLLSPTSRPSLLSHTTRYEQPSLLSPTSRPSLLSPTPRSSLLSPTSRHSLLPSSRSSFFHSPASPTNYSSREAESNEVAAAGAVLLNLDSCTVMPHSHNLVPWLPCSPQQHQQHHHFQHPGVVIQSSTTNSGESNPSMCFSTSDILRNISSYLSPKRVGADTPGFDEGSAGLGCLETSLNLTSYDNEMAVLSPAKSPSKMAGFKAAHRILTSPQPSTSGLGKRGLGALVQDQDYEFDYDSDGYADSDSELAALTRSSLPLEQWKCHECNKTFKSLKEKLLHAGKHSPSCGGPDAAGMPPFVENRPDAANFTDDCQDKSVSAKCLQVGHEDVKPLVKMELPLYGSSDAQSAAFEQQLLMQQKLSLQMLEACRTESHDFKCPECFLLFSSADELLNHRKKVLGSKNFCPLCHEEFSSWWQKSNHIKTSHISQHFTCSFCYVTYKSLSNWRRHQLVHLGLVPFECKRCGKRFTRRYEFLQHERVHTGEKPYTCPQCAKTFANESNLRRHLFTHSQDQQTSCKVCNKSYKNARSLMKHKLVVHSVAGKPAKIQRDFICSYENCGMIFPSVKKLSWHQETHQRWPKRCDFCQERFVHQSNLVKHIRQKHDPQYMQNKEGNKTCPVCFKVFLKTSLPLHMRIHSGVKPYKCYMCNKKFRVKCNLDTHMFIHSGKRDRPFKCNLCVRSFCRDKDLDAHVRSHKNIRPFICNECGKSFIHKNNLTAHMAQHSGQKEHKCAYCGKTFFRKYNLINHERVHTGETPYSCPICGKTFTQKSNYNVHRKSFHVDRHAVHEEI